MVRLFVNHATTLLLAMACVFAFGAAAYIQLPRESSPDITTPVVMISTPYPGVAPEDIEGLVTIPLEIKKQGI